MGYHDFSYTGTFTAAIILRLSSTTLKQHLNTWLAWPVVYNFLLNLGFSCSVIMLSPWSLYRVETQILINVCAAHQHPDLGWKWQLQTDKRNYKCTLFFISCAYKAVSPTLVYTLKALPAKAAKVPCGDTAYTGKRGFSACIFRPPLGMT